MTITALVADDSLFQRTIISRVAKACGYDVIQANNGRECLELALTRCPDAMVIDLNMPELRGQDVLVGLAEHGLSIPTVVVSADIQDTTRQRCLELGVRAFLNKPVNQASLEEQLHDIASV